MDAINAGDTAWILVATALVMMMTPALERGGLTTFDLAATLLLALAVAVPAESALRRRRGLAEVLRAGD